MEKYINSKGKQIIGWDEILEGGLAPNATVMSWRGTSGAIQAAKEGHDVILTPGSHCYFDHYQSDNENEPLAIGGFLPLEKVYAFDPIPEELNEQEAIYVLGAQGNVWTEYMQTEKQVEYMAFPRVVALSEVLWSSPENKNYTDFINRLEQYQKRLDQLDVNYANHMYSVKGELKNTEGNLTYQLNATSSTYPIYYSIDDTEPSKLYSNPIAVDSFMNIKAIIRDSDDKNLGSIFEQKINLHKGVGAKITIDKEPHPAYNAGGKTALINGISGNNKRYGDKEWLGFSGEDVEITIEFEAPTNINTITTRFFNANGQWIYPPKELNLQLKLEDGRAISTSKKTENNDSLLVDFSVNISQFYPEDKNLKATELKITIPSYGIIPEGKQGTGNKPWTFIDEITIK
jgi:hexosaminidase